MCPIKIPAFVKSLNSIAIEKNKLINSLIKKNEEDSKKMMITYYNDNINLSTKYKSQKIIEQLDDYTSTTLSSFILNRKPAFKSNLFPSEYYINKSRFESVKKTHSLSSSLTNNLNIVN